MKKILLICTLAISSSVFANSKFDMFNHGFFNTGKIGSIGQLGDNHQTIERYIERQINNSGVYFDANSQNNGVVFSGNSGNGGIIINNASRTRGAGNNGIVFGGWANNHGIVINN